MQTVHNVIIAEENSELHLITGGAAGRAHRAGRSDRRPPDGGVPCTDIEDRKSVV